MMDSKAWGEINGNDLKLYLYMLRKYNAKYIRGGKLDGQLISCNKDDISVPKKEYLGLDEKQAWKIKMEQRTFFKAIDHLIDLGFVKVIKDRYSERKCTIYGFNDMWNNYGKNTFNIKDEWKRVKNREYDIKKNYLQAVK